MWTLYCSVPSALWCSLSVPDSDMEGGNKKTVSWKGDETVGAGARVLKEVREYQVEEGNCTGRPGGEECIGLGKGLGGVPE